MNQQQQKIIDCNPWQHQRQQDYQAKKWCDRSEAIWKKTMGWASEAGEKQCGKQPGRKPTTDIRRTIATIDSLMGARVSVCLRVNRDVIDVARTYKQSLNNRHLPSYATKGADLFIFDSITRSSQLQRARRTNPSNKNRAQR